MEDSQRSFIGGAVVPENKVAFIFSAGHSCNRRDGVVRNSVGLRKYTNAFVAVASPNV